MAPSIQSVTELTKKKIDLKRMLKSVKIIWLVKNLRNILMSGNSEK